MAANSDKGTHMLKQKGMSFIGLVIIIAVALALFVAGMKIVPAYLEHKSVQKILDKIAAEPELDRMNKADIMLEFDHSANVGYVSVVSGKDLTIEKSSGHTVVSVEYQVVKPLAGNLSALMDFKASTQK